jgi:hypothetical protein
MSGRKHAYVCCCYLCVITGITQLEFYLRCQSNLILDATAMQHNFEYDFTKILEAAGEHSKTIIKRANIVILKTFKPK